MTDKFVVWKMHDRAGAPFRISDPVSKAEADKICGAADAADGDTWLRFGHHTTSATEHRCQLARHKAHAVLAVGEVGCFGW